MPIEDKHYISFREIFMVISLGWTNKDGISYFYTTYVIAPNHTPCGIFKFNPISLFLKQLYIICDEMRKYFIKDIRYQM